MTLEPLEHTSYFDPKANKDRDGSTGRAESQLDLTKYHQRIEQVHGSSLHNWGIASGLTTSATVGSQEVKVSLGVGLDINGRHILLAVGGQAETNPGAIAGSVSTLVVVTSDGVSLPTTGFSGDQYLTIEWRETFDNVTWLQTQGRIYQTLHTPWLRLQPTPPAANAVQNDGQQLLLGRLSLDTNGNVTNLTPEGRSYVGITLGNMQIQKITSTTTSGQTTLGSAEAGRIAPLATGGLDITLPNATDVVHTNGSLVVDGPISTPESITAGGNITSGGNISASGNVDASNIAANGTLTSTGPISTQGSITAGGNITSGGNVSASGNVNASSITASGGITANGPISTSSTTGIRQNQLYMSGAVGGSSLSYNAHRNDANNAWVFPDPSHTAVTIEMDDNAGTPRLQVYSTTTGNTTGWVERFAIDGNTGVISTTGEIVVDNASGTPTIVLNGNSAMIEVGAAGANGGITVYDASHNAVCVINGQNGKITTTTLKASQGVTAQSSGGVWALAGLATQGAVGLRATSENTRADLGTQRWAGNFQGEVNISSALYVSGPIVKSGGGFKIDHPLDPENKYLAHSFVESPDMKNIYDGIAVLDASGEAVVELPAWFAALNQDVRYQLTCIGDYAPVYIAQKMQDNTFKIAGGKPEMEVSWQVTGIRRDAWASVHRLRTEEEKPPAEQGYYLHPEEHGADAAMSIQQIYDSQSV